MLIVTYIRLIVALSLSVVALAVALWFTFYGRYGEAFGAFLVGMALALIVQPGESDLGSWDQFVKDQTGE